MSAERTIKLYNLSDFDKDKADGWLQIPIIKKDMLEPPKTAPMGFNYLMNTTKRAEAVHMFLDDYQIERCWRRPYDYVKRLKECGCVFSPDYSLYRDMPMAMQAWNVYRSRMVGQIWQNEGIKVIPTVSWSTADSFKFCFDGIEKGSICVISTQGCKRKRDATLLWEIGFEKMIEKIEPEQVWIYGDTMNYDFHGIDIVWLDNEQLVRLRKGK